MVKAKIINFSLLIISFLLLLSLAKIIIFYEVNKNYTLAAPSELCSYLKWAGVSWEQGKVPVTSLSQPDVVGSPITVKNSFVGIGLGIADPSYPLHVNGTTSVSALCFNGANCRSSWPAGGGGDGYWLFQSLTGRPDGMIGFLYPSSSLWGVSIGSSTAPSTTLHVFGDIIAYDGNPLTPDNITADNFLGTISATNISAGTFASSTGGGNFKFPASLEVVGTSSANLVLGGIIKANSELCIGSDCRTGWPDRSAANLFHFINGHLLPATTSWQFYPVRPISGDPFKRDITKFPFPYISFKDILNRFSLSSPTTTEWFDLAYGYINIDDTRFYRALYVEESDNSRNLNRYSIASSTFLSDGDNHGRRDPNDRFAWGDYYDDSGVLRSTTSEDFLFYRCQPNQAPGDGCKKLADSVAFYAANSTRHGRIVLELRVRPWKISEGNTCDNQNYNLPGMRLAMWREPTEISLFINPYNKATTTSCTGAGLRSKIQGRFIVREIYAPPDSLHSDGTVLGPSPLGNFTTLQDENGVVYDDFYFVFKSLGLAVVYDLSNK